MDEYRLIYIDIKDIIAFVSLRIKNIYDSHYKLIFFKKEDYVNL